MKLRAGASTIQKRGNTSDENEDAYAPQVDGEIRQVPFSCAVADGATETSYSRLWARLLVDSFCSVDQPELFFEQIPSLCEKWKVSTESTFLPWYAEQKLEKGAFATLLGVRVLEGDLLSLAWHALSIGDSVLFQVNPECEVVERFPRVSSDDFKSQPILLSTESIKQDSEIREHFRFSQGTMQLGHRLYLATDKIAEWIVRSVENGQKPFDLLSKAVFPSDSFLNVTAELMQRDGLKNDDFTLLWVEAIADGVG